MGAGLHDVCFKAQRHSRRLDAEPDVNDVGMRVQIDTQQHVAARCHDAVGRVPSHSAGETRDPETKRCEHLPEEQVLLIAIAAAPFPYELPHERLRIEVDGPTQHRVQVLESDGLGMSEMQGGSVSSVGAPPPA